MPAAEFHLIDHSDQVADIQRKLTILGLYHGPRTWALQDLHDALSQFQKKYRRRYPAMASDGTCDQATWYGLNQEAGSLFSEVLQYELQGLRGDQVPQQVEPAQKDQVIASAHQAHLAGLAFSGGGIRSATFNLGVLEALAQMKLLRRFDYLSSVSGGGYIAAWLSKWIMEQDGDVEQVEQALTPGSSDMRKKHEANQIKFLRQYSNYLTPRAGLFSVDSWTLIANHLRNTLLNMTLLIAALSCLFSLPGLLTWLVIQHQASPWFGVIAFAALATAVFFSAFSISLRPDPRRRNWISRQGPAQVLLLVIAPLMLAGLCGSIALWQKRELLIWLLHHPQLDALLTPGLLYFICWVAGWKLAQYFNASVFFPRQSNSAERWRSLLREGFGHLSCAIVAFALGSALLAWCLEWFVGLSQRAAIGAAAIHLVTFGMPVLLMIAGICMIFMVGLLGRLYTDRSREWWSRQGGLTTVVIMAWIALFATSLYAPPMLAWVGQQAGHWGAALLTGGWLGSTAIALAAEHILRNGKTEYNPKLGLLVLAAPYIFSIGILAMVSMLVHFAANPLHLAQPDAPAHTSLSQFLLHYLSFRSQTGIESRWQFLAACLTITALLAWRLDINKFSLYMIIRNRLVRTFLGASNPKRRPHPFTGFDPFDDPPLSRLLQNSREQMQKPYPLINATINLVGGKELAWQTRKAGAFLFSPGFCGFELARTAATSECEAEHDAMRGCFRPTDSYCGRGNRLNDEDRGGTRLGMAVAISGAAARPAMDSYHSAPMNFLMTLFNLRLGRWCGNPLRDSWRNTGPGIGLFCLLSELLGLTDARARYLHLSDGGHFDNLGIYELVRRRCQLVVAVDASPDGPFQFADLGNAIRKCYVDLRIEIEIDVSAIDAKDGVSPRQCMVGKILYSKSDPGATDGTLLYLKTALSGKELADVFNHRKANPQFPRDIRFGQWFDEDQFESYRALGYRSACHALQAAASQAELADGHDLDRLCAALAAGPDAAPTTAPNSTPNPAPAAATS